MVHRRRQDPRRAERFSDSLEARSKRAYRIGAESIDITGRDHILGLITAQNHHIPDVSPDYVVHEIADGPGIAWRWEPPGVGGHEVESVAKLDPRLAQRA